MQKFKIMWYPLWYFRSPSQANNFVLSCRFSEARPGLIVVLGLFRRMSTGTYQAEIPFVHLKELFLFRTSWHAVFLHKQ